MGRSVAEEVSRRPPTAGDSISPNPVHVGFVVGKVTLTLVNRHSPVIPRAYHTDLFICHRLYIILANDCSSVEP
jgi:hypothetical protein